MHVSLAFAPELATVHLEVVAEDVARLATTDHTLTGSMATLVVRVH